MCTAMSAARDAALPGTALGDLAEALRDASPLFSAMETTDLQDLLALASRRSVKPRQLACRKGEPGHELFIVLSGQLKVRSTSDDGREAILAYIEAGEVFGEMAIIDGRSRSADVISVATSEMLVIHRHDFLPFLESRPKACMGIVVALIQRLRRMDELVEDTRFLDLKARLAKTLHQLAQEHGRTVAGGGIRIDLRISQEELGCMVGATRENVNKLLRAWVEEGVLETSQSTLTIRAPGKLLGRNG